jgi:L-lactate dehydrogenase complex protein LldF
MRVTAQSFKANAHKALEDENLRIALGKLQHHFSANRNRAVDALPEFDRLRDEARDIKNEVLGALDFYLERFEQRVAEQGGTVHWCRTPRQARETILSLCRSVDAKTCTKGKSMIAEEIALNPFLEENGILPVETDLGEYIIQLADEPPSHIIGPAVHKTLPQVADLFLEHHKRYGKTERQTEPEALVGEAREILRQKYLDADVGITGANFLVAETGSTVIVTNEGNGDLTQMLPKMHIVISSIEKVVPTLEDLSTILRVLARSATGQEFSVYTTLSTGARQPQDLDGPSQFHVVLLDNGRSDMIGTELEDALRCIRCGACMNGCPVYHAVGGHAYGWVYPGPIGAAIDPKFIGLEAGQHLPNATPLCGKCESVCPMRIPLPKIFRYWRNKAFEEKVTPLNQRAGLELWAFFARHPELYRFVTRLGVGVLGRLGRKRGKFHSLPLASGWTDGRDMPAPEGRTFHDLWQERRGRRNPAKPGGPLRGLFS